MSNVTLHPVGVEAGVSPAFFFSDPDRVSALVLEIDSWPGTPFRENSTAKGKAGGVDCNNLCKAILTKCGVGAGITWKFPSVPMDYAMHNADSIVLQWLRGQARDPASKILASILEEIWTYPESPDSEPVARSVRIMPGDLLGFKIGKCVHHLAVAREHELEENNVHFIHCWRRVGTVIETLQDQKFSSRLRAIFRPLAVPTAFSFPISALPK